MPCYNEEKTIKQALTEMDSLFGNAQILVIDNNSSDNSASIIKGFASNHNKIEYHFCKYQGKSNAIKSVFDRIKYDTVVLQDADLEYRAFDIHKLVELHKYKHADMTIGIRDKKLIRSHLANGLIRQLLKHRFGKTVCDVLTGARVVSKNLLIQCKSHEFGLETELTKIALMQNLSIVESNCYYTPRTHGKKITAWHLFELIKMAVC